MARWPQRIPVPVVGPDARPCIRPHCDDTRHKGACQWTCTSCGVPRSEISDGPGPLCEKCLACPPTTTTYPSRYVRCGECGDDAPAYVGFCRDHRETGRRINFRRDDLDIQAQLECGECGTWYLSRADGSDVDASDSGPRHAGLCWFCSAGKVRIGQRRRALKSRLETYGITSEQYMQMLADQGGACGICHGADARSLVVDHDHDTGQVRELLCNGCNLGVGFVESPNLEKWLAYVLKWRAVGRDRQSTEGVA